MNDEYYVYALLDPRKFDAPFYVGKGKDDRWYQHLDGRCEGENRFKDHIIGAIRKNGLEPKVKFLSENMNENEAYDLETWYISLWGRRNIDPGGVLTNICLDKNPPNQKGSKRTEEQLKQMKGRTPWNKGLTKETDQRVEVTAKKVSNSLQGNIPWNKGLDITDPRVKKNAEATSAANKGNIPWNKGTVGVMNANSGSWGNKPAWNKMLLTQELIDSILNDERSQIKIANDHGISQPLVSLIKLGKRKANV